MQHATIIQSSRDPRQQELEFWNALLGRRAGHDASMDGVFVYACAPPESIAPSCRAPPPGAKRRVLSERARRGMPFSALPALHTGRR